MDERLELEDKDIEERLREMDDELELEAIDERLELEETEDLLDLDEDFPPPLPPLPPHAATKMLISNKKTCINNLLVITKPFP